MIQMYIICFWVISFSCAVFSFQCKRPIFGIMAQASVKKKKNPKNPVSLNGLFLHTIQNYKYSRN